MAQQTFEELVDAVKQAESRGKRYAADGKTLTTSPKGALGEMQVMPKTIRDPGFGVTPAKDKSPDEIARVGVDYLQAMKQKYGDTEKALIAYNWGPGSTDKWIAAGADPKKLPAETRTYVERVKGFLGKDVPRETSVAKKEREPLPASLPPMAQADIKSEVRAPSVKPEAAARVASLGPGYQAALALSFLADTDDEEDRKTTITQEYLAKAQEDEEAQAAAVAARTRQANVFADLSNTTIRSPFAEPQQPVRMKDGGDVGEIEEEEANKPFIGNPNIRRQVGQARRNAAIQKANYRDEVAEAKDTARKGEAYQELEKYLQSRDAVPSISVSSYLPEGTHGMFSSDRPNITTGSIKVNKNLPEMYMPSTIAHEVTHAADRQMEQQAMEQGLFGKSNQFTEAYKKMVGKEGRNRTQLLRKRYPEFEEDNRYYRSRPDEVAAHGIGAYSGPVMQDNAPRHVDATAATEFRILMDLAQRNVDKGPTGLGKILPFFRKIEPYADGGEVEQERLTMQQIERIAAQEAAAREQASTAAFIAQKSGIGRKAGPVSQALQSGDAYIAAAKGVTEMPYNFAGAPMDIAMLARQALTGQAPAGQVGTSEYIKKMATEMGIRPAPPTDPTLRGFYDFGDIGSSALNPASVPRAAARGASAVAEKAGDAARDFQLYNRQLEVPGASYAVRNKGTPIAMTGLPFKPFVDEAEEVVNAVKVTRKGPLDVTDKPLGDWFSKTVARYLRSDFATPSDQLVQAAEKGQLLHLAPKNFTDRADDQILKKLLERRQADLPYVREAEGFPKSNMATQPYGKLVEDITDISAYPERVGDLTPNRVPVGMRDIVETRPEARVTDYAPGIVQNLKLDELRDKMLEVRQSNSLYGAYGQPKVKIPAEFLLPDDTLLKQNVAAASHRMARYTNWQDETRQRMATTALRSDPQFSRASLQDGKYIGVALPDVRKNPEIRQLVTDVGCDGGWCTRYEQNAKTYGGGFSRLHIMVTGEGKKARPVAQFSVADSGAGFEPSKRFSITEIKEKGNTADFKNNPALPAIQEYVKFLDKSYGGLDYVDDLKGLNMVNMREELRFPSMPHSKGEYSSQGLLDKLLKVNGNSYYASKDEFPTLIKKANELPNNAARQIQMNLFQPPKEKATGGMMERQANDNRRYL